MTSRGAETWKAHTTAFDRVRSVAVTLTQPRSADWIAEEAHVAGNTAREHLQRLVGMNVLLEDDTRTPTTYRPDPLYLRMQSLRELMTGKSRDDLLEQRASNQERIEMWRAEYDADAPEDLYERAASTETAAETRDLKRAANEWAHATYQLDLLADAIENYERYADDTPAMAH